MDATPPVTTADGRLRRRWLDELGLLDASADPLLDGLVRCAALITGCPIALVTLLDDERQWFRSSVGLDLSSTPLEQAFCRHTIAGDVLYEVPDARADPLFSANPLVTGEPGIRYYAGVSVGAGIRRLGALCVIDRRPRSLSASQRQALEALASAVTGWIEARQQQRALLQSESRLNTLLADQRRAARAHEAAVADAHRRELAANRMALEKSVFFSRLSHELRTPLNAVQGFAQLLLIDSAQPLTAAQRQRVQHIERAGDHLLSLLNDVLGISRFEHKGHVLELEPLPLAQAVADCVTMLEPLARQAQVRIDVDASILALQVQADRRALTQVLMNVLSNGIKYNRQGGLLRIRAEVHGSSLDVVASDEGAGIPSDRRHELFQPFNRLGAENSQVEGTGLGLVIARQLSQAMGGALELDEDAAGSGSSFRLRLPCPSADGGERG